MTAPLTQVGPDGRETGYCSSDWYFSLFAMQQRLGFSPQVITQPLTSLTGQSASIAPTSLTVGAVPAGAYRISWYARVTTAATTSSSLTVSFAWTDPDGTVLSGSGAAMTGNTTSTTQSGSVVIKVKGDTPISYSTTYASVGGTAMVFALSLMAEYLGS